MDEIELLVEQTYRHFEQKFPHADLISPSEIIGMRQDWEFNLPVSPGVIYHVQKSARLFVLRTFVSKNIKHDLSLIMESPENYPSLRLLESGGENIENNLRFFEVDDLYQAEMIHHQVNNRRFPLDEESICNISDPGFSWWQAQFDNGFQISFNLSHNEDQNFLKLGPLGDQKLAMKRFEEFFHLIEKLELNLNFQFDFTKIIFSGDDEFLIHDLEIFFKEGEISDSVHHLFKLLAKSCKDSSSLESLWFYFQELAAMRRFWIKIQEELTGLTA
jgi:hypothetical protein